MKEENLVSHFAEHMDEVKTNVQKYGNVPVTYVPKKEWVTPQRTPSLSHFILNATTVEEVNKLLERGKTKFVNAQPKTIKRWEADAAKRIAELQSAKK